MRRIALFKLPAIDDDAYVGVVDEETELARLRAEVENLTQSLAREREIRRSVVDHAPDFIVQCNVHGTILFINRLAPGFDLADVLGAPVTRFLPPDAHEIALQTMAKVVATRTVQTYESMGAGPNGEPTHYFTRVAPVFADGEVTSVLLFATDVDRLKKAEAELLDRDARLRIIVDAAKMGVWWVDFAAGTADADELGRATLGLPDGPLTLALGLRSVPEEDREEIRIAVEGSLVTGSYGPLVHRVVLASGTTRWVRTVGHLRKDTQRLIGGVVDITEQKRLEIQVAQAQKLDSIGRLAGGVAHDFNNLLTAIFGSVYHARRQLPAGSPTLEELSHIQAAAERAAALTAQLLAFARRQVVETRVVAFATVVSEIERLLRRVLGEDIELSSVHGATGHIRVDPHQLERVLMNLATNARDAMPGGGRLMLETSDVELDADYAASHAEVAAGRYVVLAVTDTGHGIPAIHLPHIFEPFYTTKSIEQGTGLGLATSYGIVRQAGGHIQVYSEAGQGSTFRIYLPRVDEDVDLPRVHAPTDARGNETLLVVEDEESVRLMTVRALRQLGYTVLDAGTGIAALEVAAAHPGTIDLLITDVVMPKLNGPELAERLRVVRPRLTVLFVSGYAEHAIVHHGVLDTAVEFLEKPFTIPALHERVREILDRR